MVDAPAPCQLPSIRSWWQICLVGILIFGLLLAGVVPLHASASTQQGPEFDVRIKTTTSPVFVDETLKVFATVRNTGNTSGSQTVTLSIYDVVRDQREVSLSPGEGTSVVLSWKPAVGDAGTPVATVASETDLDRTNVTVRPPEHVQVESCTVIDTPGVYVLDSKITNANIDPCIRIAASNVTFDGAGFTVDGVERHAGTVGLEVDTRKSRRNVEIRNLTLTGWGTGLQVGTTPVTGIEHSVIENVRANDNRHTGIAVSRATTTVIENASLDHNPTGLLVANASDVEIRGSTARNHTDAYVVRDSSDVAIRKSTARDNTNAIVFETSSGNLVADTVLRNQTTGIRFHGAANNTVRNTSITKSDDLAVHASPAAATGSSKNNTFERIDFGFETATVSFRIRDGGIGPIDPSAVPTPPPGLGGMGVYLNTTTTARDGFVSLTVAYSEEATEGLTESSLGMWRYDGSWSALGGRIDPSANTASITTKFADSLIALLASGFENEPPNVTFTYSPKVIEMGDTGYFYVTDVSDPDGTIERYVWLVDGNVVSTNQSIRYKFDTGSTHEVSLQVVDNRGGTVERTVTIDVVTPTAKPTETVTETPTPEREVPGFGIPVAVVGFVVIAFLAHRRK